MGRDKALLELDGRTLAERAAAACHQAGCATVLTIGGDRHTFEDRGLHALPDEHPGQGPLGGILTALAAAPADSMVFVVAVDVPGLSATSIGRVLDALAHDEAADVAMPRDGTGRRHHLHAAWRQRCRVPLAAAFTRGERAVRRALADLTVIDVDGIDESSLVDVDTPGELRQWRRTRGITDEER